MNIRSEVTQKDVTLVAQVKMKDQDELVKLVFQKLTTDSMSYDIAFYGSQGVSTNTAL